MKKLTLISLLSALVVSCSSEKAQDAERPPVPISFTSTVTGQPFHPASGGYTRAYDADWSAGDQIGIFMFEHGVQPASEILYLDNRRYITAGGDGVFVSGEGVVDYFPEDGTTMDFIAYYPYSELSDGRVDFDLTNQLDQEALDFMYSRTSRGYDFDNPDVPLSFSHQLTKLVFNVSFEEGISSAGLTFTVKDIVTDGHFDLFAQELVIGSTVGDIRMFGTSASNKAVAEAVVMPQGDVAGKELVIRLADGTSLQWTFPAGTNWNQGDKHIYDVNIKGGEPTVVKNYGWFETPAVTSIDNTVFLKYSLPEPENADMRNYSMLYDTEYMIAYWVAYPMCEWYREGASSATNYNGNWIYDDQIPRENQPNIISGSWPPSAYDRGHQLPSADRRYSWAANRSTYYTTNQTAQNSTMNKNVWADLEDRVRVWMTQCDTVYVVTGAMITTKDNPVVEFIQDNSGKSVALPKYYYKAIAKYTIATNEYHTIAYKMDNQAVPRPYTQYSLSVSELEEETGFTFFPYLSDDIKSTVTSGQW